MRIIKLIIPALAVAAAFTGCRTTEANYRAAYEKTMQARAEQDSLESTVYGRERRNMQSRTIDTPSGPVQVVARLVRVTDGGGGLPESLRRYNVVVGQFKQLFNAKSLRNRLADGGYPGAFVVETGEPYYYIVLASYSDAAEAQKEMERFAASGTLAMKEPCPFILDATARRSPTHR